jgi:hypothetical protein
VDTLRGLTGPRVLDDQWGAIALRSPTTVLPQFHARPVALKATWAGPGRASAAAGYVADR